MREYDEAGQESVQLECIRLAKEAEAKLGDPSLEHDARVEQHDRAKVYWQIAEVFSQQMFHAKAAELSEAKHRARRKVGLQQMTKKRRAWLVEVAAEHGTDKEVLGAIAKQKHDDGDPCITELWPNKTGEEIRVAVRNFAARSRNLPPR